MVYIYLAQQLQSVPYNTSFQHHLLSPITKLPNPNLKPPIPLSTPTMRSTLVATGLTLTATAYGSASCATTAAIWGIVGYAIGATGVEDIPKTCGDLWQGLKQFHDCIGVGIASCGKDSDGKLVWNFTNGSGCNKGMVQSAWWEATKNKYGAIDCQIN
jgi:hypothetical protein